MLTQVLFGFKKTSIAMVATEVHKASKRVQKRTFMAASVEVVTRLDQGPFGKKDATAVAHWKT